jgi:hypothetical protein
MLTALPHMIVFLFISLVFPLIGAAVAALVIMPTINHWGDELPLVPDSISYGAAFAAALLVAMVAWIFEGGPKANASR